MYCTLLMFCCEQYIFYVEHIYLFFLTKLLLVSKSQSKIYSKYYFITICSIPVSLNETEINKESSSLTCMSLHMFKIRLNQGIFKHEIYFTIFIPHIKIQIHYQLKSPISNDKLVITVIKRIQFKSFLNYH